MSLSPKQISHEETQIDAIRESKPDSFGFGEARFQVSPDDPHGIAEWREIEDNDPIYYGHGFDDGTAGSLDDPILLRNRLSLKIAVVWVFSPVGIPEKFVEVDDGNMELLAEFACEGGFAGTSRSGDVDVHIE